MSGVYNLLEGASFGGSDGMVKVGGRRKSHRMGVGHTRRGGQEGMEEGGRRRRRRGGQETEGGKRRRRRGGQETEKMGGKKHRKGRGLY